MDVAVWLSLSREPVSCFKHPKLLAVLAFSSKQVLLV